MTFSRASESNKHCNGILCDQEGVNLRKDAHTSATISTVGFIAGGVLAAGGLVVTLTAGRSKKAAAGGRIWLAPEVGRGGSRVTLGGAF
jgi:hypothetical protein